MEKPRAPKGRWYMAGASSSESLSMQLQWPKYSDCAIPGEVANVVFLEGSVRSALPGIGIKCCVRFMNYDDLPYLVRCC